MPELPEVTTVANQLTHLIIHQTIKGVDILHKKSFPHDSKLIIGAKIASVRRIAKMIVIELSNGFSIVVHLKMTGQIRIMNYELGSKKDNDNLFNKHTRVIITFQSGDQLIFNDQRKFGWMKIFQSSKLKDLQQNIGPDALIDLNPDILYKILQTSKKPIKSVLMDQTKIAGIGNIYANEALFLSRIHSQTAANKLSAKQSNLLYKNILQVLTAGIKWGGASRTHFVDVYGKKGEVQKHFYVYDREGKECPNKCGGKIKRIKIGGRSTFLCPKCQK